ncbi:MULTISPECIES: hypothetical protein [unclassified Nonomuraea]|uniref:hypothetical protein n=1 Tax=unclassified Nonomuraea TaxID=2593643 RepID=UPI0033F8CFD4
MIIAVWRCRMASSAEVPSPQVAIDAGGRSSSGRRFLILTEEYGQFIAESRERWGNELPLPYEEFAEPYNELRNELLDDCRGLGTTLLGIGDGQIVMSGRNMDVEQVNTMNALRLGRGPAEA